MSANVEPEEAQAIREILDEGMEAEGSVTERDFREPRRLSAKALEDLERQLSGIVTDIEGALSESTGSRWPMGLARVGEASAAGLFDDDEGPFAALRFEASGQIGWITWSSKAAVRAVESILGAAGAEAKARLLTDVECTVLNGLLAPIADATLRALDIKADGVAIAQSKEALGDWMDVGETADPYRLHVEFKIEGPGKPSKVHLYLPAPITPEQGKGAARKPAHLPAHLNDVEIEVAVRIEGCDVSLEQLLALEEGDVIPLDARLNEPAMLCVDGRVIGTGQLGSHDGHLALRIEQTEQEHPENS